MVSDDILCVGSLRNEMTDDEDWVMAAADWITLGDNKTKINRQQWKIYRKQILQGTEIRKQGSKNLHQAGKCADIEKSHLHPNQNAFSTYLLILYIIYAPVLGGEQCEVLCTCPFSDPLVNLHNS